MINITRIGSNYVYTNYSLLNRFYVGHDDILYLLNNAARIQSNAIYKFDIFKKNKYKLIK
jgi:hypothetical protein